MAPTLNNGSTDGHGVVTTEVLAGAGHCAHRHSYSSTAAPSVRDGRMRRRTITDRLAELPASVTFRAAATPLSLWTLSEGGGSAAGPFSPSPINCASQSKEDLSPN